MVLTSSSISMNNCVFDAVLPNGLIFVFDFGKRKKNLRVPQAHLPTPDDQTKTKLKRKNMVKARTNQICTHTMKKSPIDIHETQQLQNKPTKYSRPIQTINHNDFGHF